MAYFDGETERPVEYFDGERERLAAGDCDRLVTHLALSLLFPRPLDAGAFVCWLSTFWIAKSSKNVSTSLTSAGFPPSFGFFFLVLEVCFIFLVFSVRCFCRSSIILSWRLGIELWRILLPFESDLALEGFSKVFVVLEGLFRCRDKDGLFFFLVFLVEPFRSQLRLLEVVLAFVFLGSQLLLRLLDSLDVADEALLLFSAIDWRVLVPFDRLRIRLGFLEVSPWLPREAFEGW